MHLNNKFCTEKRRILYEKYCIIIVGRWHYSVFLNSFSTILFLYRNCKSTSQKRDLLIFTYYRLQVCIEWAYVNT